MLLKSQPVSSCQHAPRNWNGIRSWKPSSGLSMRLWVPWSPHHAPCSLLLSSSLVLSHVIPSWTAATFHMTSICTHLQLSSYARPPQKTKHSSACLETSVLNVFLITSTTGRGGRTLQFFPDKVWCRTLTSNPSSMSNTLPLSEDLHYLFHLPPQTCSSFCSFPPGTLCLSHLSFPLASYFLTFLRA